MSVQSEILCFDTLNHLFEQKFQIFLFKEFNYHLVNNGYGLFLKIRKERSLILKRDKPMSKLYFYFSYELQFAACDYQHDGEKLGRA